MFPETTNWKLSNKTLCNDSFLLVLFKKSNFKMGETARFLGGNFSRLSLTHCFTRFPTKFTPQSSKSNK